MGHYMQQSGRFQNFMTWSYVGLSIVAFGWILVAGTDFSNDDLDFFAHFQKGNLFELMLTPLNGHWTPFHRISSWLVYQPGGMKFEAMIGILLAFHLMAVVYLRETLAKLGAGTTANVVACAYASCAFLLYGMIGIANAQLRVPHVALCAMAIFHYVAWLQGGGKRHASLAVIAYLLDLGVFQKAVLVPVYMGLAGWLAVPERFRQAPLKPVLLPASLLLVSFAVVLAYKANMPASRFVPSPSMIAAFEWRMIGSLLAGILGVAADTRSAEPGINMGLASAALVVWLVAACASIRAAHGVWKAWAAMLFILALDFLPLTSSDRTAFGQMVVYSYRYYYESVYLVFLMLGLICALHARRQSFRLAPSTVRSLALATLAIYLLIQSAALSFARSHSFDFRLGAQVHGYMRNLRDGLARIKEERPVFMDSPAADYMFMLNDPDINSRIVPLLMPHARFEPSPGQPYYYVLTSGEVVHRVPTAKP